MSQTEADDPSRPAKDAGPTGKSEPSAPSEPAGEPAAWPPQEAAPREEEAAPETATASAANGQPAPESGLAEVAATPAQTAATPAEATTAATPAEATTVATPAEAAPTPVEAAANPAGADRGGGSTPAQEMGFSDSTLHWLADGDLSQPMRASGPVTLPSFDPRAPVAGRRRAVLVVGGAGILALGIAGGFFLQSTVRRSTEPPAPVRIDPARDLTSRAQAAFAGNRIAEALDLARLALVADARFADAHFVVAECERAGGQTGPARDHYRKYLDLAPLGTHAAAARAALAALPP